MRWLRGGNGDVDIATAYAWPSAPRWVRAMMVMSVDGAIAGPDGRSGSISNPTDRAIMAEVRREADAVLIGASTMRAERYSPMRGRPTLVMVSASLDLPWQEPVFTDSDQQPMVVTSTTADSARLDAAREFAEVIELQHLDGAAIIAALVARGFARIVCEGGARLLGSLIMEVNEFDVTISPQLLLAGQVLLDADLPVPRQVELVQAIEDAGFVFAKYQAA